MMSRTGRGRIAPAATHRTLTVGDDAVVRAYRPFAAGGK